MALDSVWILVSAFLVFFMHAGFALVESGFCRRKNAVMVLLKNFGVLTVASLLYFALGFGLMFGAGNAIVGLTGFMPAADQRMASVPAEIPLFVFLFFQLVFAATAATIVSGAVAERARLAPFLAFTAVASALIYPIVGHWVWGGGFLATMGFHDFAGSTVVHGVGGAMGLAGALILGPRLGKYDEAGRSRPMPAHNFPLAALGVLILWLGWFGFNGGSTLAADPAAIASVVLVTNLSGAAGFLAALIHNRYRTGGLDLSMALNGVLAGLVAITAGADVMAPVEAVVVGALAGLLVVEGVLALDRWHIDDPVGAVAVHLLAGAFGTVAVALFAEAETCRGLLHGGSWTFLGVQLMGVLLSCGFAGAAGTLTWLVLQRCSPVGLRVSREHEVEGLDIAECGVEAYGEELLAGLRAPSAAAAALQRVTTQSQDARLRTAEDAS
ncbi:MAG: ammonium transporter [Polyangiales bacterium]